MDTSSKVIEKIYKNSLEIIDSLDKKIINVDDLYNMVKSNRFKSLSISSKNKKKLLSVYTKDSILDEILFLTDNRYKHLKDIRGLVNLDNLIEYILPEKIYTNKVKVYYTNIIIDRILEKYYDYESSKLLSDLKLELLDIETTYKSFTFKPVVGNSL